MEEKQKICLTIAGLDPSGGAGITADIKTFTSFGCFAASAITSITFQNTQGVFGAEHQTAKSVRQQIEPILEDYPIASLKTGMLPTKEVIEEVSKIIKENKLESLVVDPVVRSTSGYDLIDDKALQVLINQLFPLAKIITPNIPEAERITQIEIKSEKDIIEAASIMMELGAENILIKGGHFAKTNSNKERVATDYLFIGESLQMFETEYIYTNSTHGTGCSLAAAITANLGLEKSLAESVGIAKTFVHNGIKHSPNIGKGHSPIGI